MNNADTTFISFVFLIIGLIGGWGIGRVTSPRPLEITRTEIQVVTKTVIRDKPRIVIVKEKVPEEKNCSSTSIGTVFGFDSNNQATFGVQILTDLNSDVSVGFQVQNNGTYLGILGVKF